MITKVTASTIVDAPLREVYDQWTQFEDFPRFMEAVKSVTQLGDERTHWEVDIAGVERAFDAVITEQLPDQLIRWESQDEQLHIGEVQFENAAGGTRVSLMMGWVPEGIMERVGAALNLDERAAERDLERFKEFMNERGTATGGWRGSIGER
ncbi:SRPBCC family protein [Microbacterium sp. YY-01]|uniref:SRPBCC family protein n=1 Tax=Microbacterium sp. YY-01 TaxID=3421634 RepID=UPI003D168CC4